MPISGESELVAGDLEIEIAVHNRKTMSVRRVKHGQKLRFNNKKEPRKLLISSPADVAPFVLQAGTEAVSWFEVDPNDTRDVTIAPHYGPESWFTYTAQIDGSGAEDPIVIIDRR